MPQQCFVNSYQIFSLCRYFGKSFVTVCTHTSQILIRGATTIEVFFFSNGVVGPRFCLTNYSPCRGATPWFNYWGPQWKQSGLATDSYRSLGWGSLIQSQWPPSNPPARLHNCHYEYGESILSVCAFQTLERGTSPIPYSGPPTSTHLAWASVGPA